MPIISLKYDDYQDPTSELGFKVVALDSSGPRTLVITDVFTDLESKNNEVLCWPYHEVLNNILSRVAANVACSRVVITPYNAPGVAKEDRLKRVKYLIKTLKITRVFVSGPELGPYLIKSLCGVDIDFRYLGRVFPSIKNDYTVGFSLSLQQLATSNYEEAKTFPNLLGTWMEHIEQAIVGKNYQSLDIDLSQVPKKLRVIDTLAKFDKFFPYLEKQNIVAIDTETASLNRHRNQLYSIQFCTEQHQDVAWFLPFNHPNSPFTAKETEYIRQKLQHYFEYPTLDKENPLKKYHIYHNAKFDLAIIKICLGARRYNWPIYDTIAGEFSHNENVKFLQSYRFVAKTEIMKGVDKTTKVKADGKTVETIKYGPYKLDNVAIRYGQDVYSHLAFSKEDRKNMEHAEWQQFVEYACIDVIVTFAIARLQIAEAIRIGRRDFLRFMLNQFSSMVRVFAIYETNGLKVDARYLAMLQTPYSPLEKGIEEARNDIFKEPSVIAANDILLKDQPALSTTFMGDKPFIFSLRKVAHKKLWFFDERCLGLQPLGFGKSGAPQTNKKFLNHYAKTSKAVATYQVYNQVLTAKTNFSVKLYERLQQDESKIDHRIRCSIDFRDVVTGRTSSANPNLQNLPQHNKVAKVIKRIFITEAGTIKVKFDYSSHEVRMWGNTAGDVAIASRFHEAAILKIQYRILMSEMDKAFNAYVKIQSAKSAIKKAEDTFKDNLKKTPQYEKTLTKDYEAYKVEAESQLKALETKYKKYDNQFGLIAELEKNLQLKGDIHIQNVKLFFNKDVDKKHPLRQAIKAVVFGVTYGKGAKSLSADIYNEKELKEELKGLQAKRAATSDKKTAKELDSEIERVEGILAMEPEEYAQSLIDKMFAGFPQGAQYIKNHHINGAKRLQIRSPIGRVRHLFGYLHHKQSVKNAMNRRGPNSDIQGFSSDIGCVTADLIDRFIWDHFTSKGFDFPAKLLNYIHDSVETECPVHLVPIWTYIVEHAATTLIHKELLKVYGFEFVSGLESEFAVGYTDSNMTTWNYNWDELGQICYGEANMKLVEEIHGPKTVKEILGNRDKYNHNREVMEEIRLKELNLQLENPTAPSMVCLLPKLLKSGQVELKL